MSFMTIDRHIDDSLEHETEATLNRKILAELITLCQERDLPAEGGKHVLIQELLEYKHNTRAVPAPSAPRLHSRSSSMDDGYLSGDSRSLLNSQHLALMFLDKAEDQVSFEKLIYGRKLGSGGFKDCYSGVFEGRPVAIGELRISQFTENDIIEVRNEIDVLKQLRHENVTRFVGVCTNPKHLCIVTELCENGDLFDYMRKTKKPGFSQMVMFMHDIALGISYLHTRRPSIIHRDMKSMNVLISADSRAKINDFGLARIRPRANTSIHTQVGTPNWQAPEFWTAKPSYTEKVDVYACGLIYWEILGWGELGFPFQNMTEHVLYEQVRDNNHRPPMDKLVTNYPRNLLDLIGGMWAKDPRSRPSMTYVLEQLAKFLE